MAGIAEGFTPADLELLPAFPGVRYKIVDGELLVSSHGYRFTSADLERFPDFPGVLYEIIDGELLVSTQPQWRHQYARSQICGALNYWSQATGRGTALHSPGLVFSPDNDVAPDVIWISWERLAEAEDSGGHFRLAPEIAVEVLSPGRANERRDRERKLQLYSRQGVQEYWIVDWQSRLLEVYRPDAEALRLVATLRDDDVLTTPLLPGFSCPVATLWELPLQQTGHSEERER